MNFLTTTIDSWFLQPTRSKCIASWVFALTMVAGIFGNYGCPMSGGDLTKRTCAILALVFAALIVTALVVPIITFG